MVLADQAVDRGREAAELAQQAHARLGMALDLGVLLVGERAGLAEDVAGDGELADVVQQAADREVAQRRGREAERLADLHGQQRDAARVALGRAVVGAEADHQRAHPRAEVRLLGRDDLGRP